MGYSSDIRDRNGRFLPAIVIETVEYAWALHEHKDYPMDYAEEIALANPTGRDLTDNEVTKFFEVLECY